MVKSLLLVRNRLKNAYPFRLAPLSANSGIRIEGRVVVVTSTHVVLEEVVVDDQGTIERLGRLTLATTWLQHPKPSVEEDDSGAGDQASFFAVPEEPPRVPDSAMRSTLTIDLLKDAASFFARESFMDASLYGVTDGKAIGTSVERKFKEHLAVRYDFDAGNAALGVDFPSVLTDLKVTSLKQPQSSSPFTSIRQKIYGLGHNLLVFVYDKSDDPKTRSSTLDFTYVMFIDAKHTGDNHLTTGLRNLVQNGAPEGSIIAFLRGAGLLVDLAPESSAALEVLRVLAREVLTTPPDQGYLSLCNAMQWRLQYHHAMGCAPFVESGLIRLR